MCAASGHDPQLKRTFQLTKLVWLLSLAYRQGLWCLLVQVSPWHIMGLAGTCTEWGSQQQGCRPIGARSGEHLLAWRAARPRAAVGLVCLQCGQKEEQAGPCVTAKVTVDVT